MKKLVAIAAVLVCLPASAEVPVEAYGRVSLEQLPPRALVINTFDGGTSFYNADTREMLGMISTGIDANAFEIDRTAGVMYTAETFLSRHTRGERTDVITVYDIENLSAIDEIVIPPKHAGGSPMRHYSGIVRNDEAAFMLVTNMTPAVSVSVANLTARQFVAEIPTPGCGLVYPVDGLGFLQLCGDGAAQLITLDAGGKESNRTRSARFFDLEHDPLMEKPVPTPRGWLFNTFKGQFFLVSTTGKDITVEPRFALEQDGWLVGGMQPLAYHAGADLLLTLMHEGGDHSHKDPGTEVWYLDPVSGDIRHRLALQRPATSLQVSQDDAPLIYAGTVFENRVDIYDLKSTTLTGSIEEPGIPTILQNL